MREADRARRILYRAREDGLAAAGHSAGPPLPARPPALSRHAGRDQENAARITDPNFRIQVAPDGIHVYNRAGHHTAADPFDLFPRLGVESDGGHAFYLGVELARAETALELGKRYVQDQKLGWGCAVDRPAEDETRLKAPGTTREARRRRKETT